MMFLGQNELFGELSIQEVFLAYDGPRLFMAENAAEQKFLFNCLVSDENSLDTWLAVPISEKRLFSLKAKSLLLRDAFLKPELGRVFEVVTDRSGNLVRHSDRKPVQLQAGDLPEPEVYLQQHGAERENVNAVLAAKSLAADIVLLHLYPDSTRHEAPAKAVGQILSSFQDFLSERLLTIPALANVKAPDISFVSTFAGSFGIELAVRGEDKRIGEVLKEAVNGLGTALEPNAFVERMGAIAPSESSAVTKFIKTLRRAKTDLKVETASRSDAEVVSAVVPLKKLRTSLKALKKLPTIAVAEDALDVVAMAAPELRTVEVEMIGLNLRTKKFELRRIADAESIHGTMAAEIFSDLKKAEIPSRYRVVLEPVGLSGTWKMISATKLLSGNLG
jgi:hypothetical protein